MNIYNIISRQEAKDNGFTRYFTGAPCKHGHISQRLVSNKYCIECQNAANRKRRGNKPRIKTWCKKEANARRRAKCKLATFAEFLPEVRQIYRECPEGYQVDHIVPLNGKNVCGLHVPWNLQYLTPEENVKKGNRLVNE